MKGKLTTSAKIWGYLCITVNAILLIISSIALQEKEEAGIIISIIFCALLIIGYTILLNARKGGFYMICLCALTAVIINIINHNYLQAGFNFLNPIIAWVFIKESWNSWKREKQYKEENYYRKLGRKYKTWSIVNTCILSVTILPILGIIESNKAMKATTDDEYYFHIRKARFYNLCAYGIIIVISIIRGILVEGGIIPPST